RGLAGDLGSHDGLAERHADFLRVELSKIAGYVHAGDAEQVRSFKIGARGNGIAATRGGAGGAGGGAVRWLLAGGRAGELFFPAGAATIALQLGGLCS